jgi:hypothetical protein
MKELAREVAHQHERTSQAKEVSGDQQRQNQRAAKVNPAESGGQIFWRQGRPKESVQDHRQADDEKWNLECGASMTPAK